MKQVDYSIADAHQEQVLAEFTNVNESVNHKRIFVLENGSPVIGLGSNLKSKYTLNWCMESAKNVDEFINTVQHQIADRLDYQLSLVDKNRLKADYQSSKFI